MNNKSTNIRIQFAVLMATYLCSFILAYVIKDSSLARDISGLWPKFDTLQAHCATSPCVYAPSLVGMVYVTQPSIAILYLITVIILCSLRKTLLSRPITVMLLVFVALLYLLFRATMAKFSFEIDSYSVFSNSISSNYLSLLRPTWVCVLLSLCSLAFLSSRARKDETGG
jgi:hypothetical protein